ncbi:MAG: hypothetical protein A3J07_01700 [Candidatus Doudnabacteria bacterium RIFCSPLOWO2_02_FULL_49_13]|uniref:Uncharacterized protein n=1 Tax=Candidatus Doudnabacteria bacterium RIFCSPHIGHO2_12_FULL_48_16 TaxID=1817838 RepID=A0A1F5PL67_9BACT|nr:MAG: hypothetical protein A3B77_01015 [Candidatus Doudnabacteria bacterium RIFCSPHIGHO2_02_FULL_49_24]OGE88823.1 MAG: hypothetical protein A2760_01370 [Candidatus Doudnabacteria bacterium RIFCSPHIGHO2_01_FULL_50_67]OGE90656.1 MAG: hypothetical protein A3E29_00795 [Candidatus Doudnabacteria bacterium RIFCSPHIGHO2_12_FULL_48_16]OGE96988.1 MAG: hypothetical protein A2990_02825 [Candidatus Doudnabacteria bacterium RIFCSPLOWO2_01_FULL_49_40]OGF02522.1 MAG: hypothetical protein A3J07_01700 [Candid
MTQAAEKLFYGLAGFILLTALFVLQPTNRTELAALQDEMTGRLSVAWQQTMGDGPYFDNLILVFDSINEFYGQAGNASLALLEHGVGDRDLAVIGRNFYHELAFSLSHLADSGQILAAIPSGIEFMSEPPIYNIVPVAANSGAVAGALVEPVNGDLPWVTMRDNLTGQLYCIAIYNSEVNKYLGPCKYDYR